MNKSKISKPEDNQSQDLSMFKPLMFNQPLPNVDESYNYIIKVEFVHFITKKIQFFVKLVNRLVVRIVYYMVLLIVKCTEFQS